MTYFALEWTSEFIHINNYLQTLIFKIWTGKAKIGGGTKWGFDWIGTFQLFDMTTENKAGLQNLVINATFEVFKIANT